MSRICLDVNYINFKKMRLGRLICSFILLFSIVCFSNVLLAQTSPVASEQITNSKAVEEAKAVVSLSDRDGDGLVDAVFENKDIKLIISSKTGGISFYYLKGEKYAENFYPPQIIELGYAIPNEYMKLFEFDNSDNTLSETNYNIEVESNSETEIVVKVTSNISTLVDENTPDSKSLSIVRRYILPASGYLLKIDNIVTNLKERLVVVGNDASGSFNICAGPGIFMDPFGPNTLVGLKNQGESEFFTRADSLNEKGKSAGVYTGVGIKDQYFCILMESDQPLSISSIASQTVSANANRRSMTTNIIKCVLPKFNIGAKETRNFSFNIYAGPIILEELSKINRRKVADFGWLNTKMLETLRYFYSLIPNYGVAIILLTLLVRLILYPLTLKQTKEMAKMQKLQPKMKEIQDKFRDDPQKMNEEVMKLYTKNKVNPLGGCLPLFLQLPIIMALFNTLRNAVELRKASFLWMSDLSKGDPYLILPIAIAALMYYQQGKANIDPQQQQAMAFMPIMMLVFTFSLPSGLLVYWFASSVLGLLQQLQTNKLMASMKED